MKTLSHHSLEEYDSDKRTNLNASLGQQPIGGACTGYGQCIQFGLGGGRKIDCINGRCTDTTNEANNGTFKISSFASFLNYYFSFAAVCNGKFPISRTHSGGRCGYPDFTGQYPAIYVPVVLPGQTEGFCCAFCSKRSCDG